MSVLDTDQHRFINNLRILNSLDRHEIEAQLGRPMSGHEWLMFAPDPFTYLIRADAPISAAIWRAIERRQPKPTVAAV